MNLCSRPISFEYIGDRLWTSWTTSVTSAPGPNNPEIFRASNCDEAGNLLAADDPDSLWNNLTEYWHTEIQELCDWSTQPQFVFKHHWRRHDVVMWDNRPTMHAREAFDYGNQRRIMHRTTLVGDTPVV